MGACESKSTGRGLSDLFGTVSRNSPWSKYTLDQTDSSQRRAEDPLVKIYGGRETATGNRVTVREIFCNPTAAVSSLEAELTDIISIALPNVQRVRYAFIPDTVYLIMDPLPVTAVPLSRYLATSSPSWETIQSIYHEMTVAINGLHKVGFAHGFLSLESFVVVPPGAASQSEGGAGKLSDSSAAYEGKPHVMLVDFGLELKFGRNVGTFVAVGVARCASPELAVAVGSGNTQPVCAEADVFALGAIGFALFTGRFLVGDTKQRELFRLLRTTNFGDQIARGELANVKPPQLRMLLSKMLQLDRAQRPTMPEVVSDHFFSSVQAQLDPKDMQVLLQTFKEYASRTTMQKLLLATVTLRVDPEHHGQASAEFAALDKDKSGRLGLDEFVKAFKEQQVTSKEDLERMFKSMDIDGSGTIDYAEFLAAARGVDDVPLEDRLVRAFEMWDTDGNGYIDRRDLARVCEGLYSEVDLEAIVNQSEKTKNGKICYSEFLQLAQLPNTPSVHKTYNMKQAWTQIKDADPYSLYENVAGAAPLGEGMTGKVYQIRSKTTGVLYAGKRVSIGRGGDSKAALMNEIQLLIDMDHPNIVRLHEVLEAANSLYLVMELCTGGELYDDLINREVYTEVDAAKLFHQMCASIAYVHHRGIAHRDLKLENFIFQNKEKSSPLKLIDFGLSRKVQGRLSKMVSVVGTAYYMAPEVVNRRSEYRVGKGAYYTKQCDMWSLGVLLYMMLSGVPPFDGDDDTEIRAAVQAGVYSEGDIAHCSDLAKDLIRQLLEIDPQKRVKSRDVLKHPWFDIRFNEPSKNESSLKHIVGNIKNFHNMCRLKQTVMSLVAFEMSDAKVEELRQAFVKFDTDHSGTLSLDEFRAAMKGKIAEQEVEKLFQAIDFDKSGSIAYSEFISATIHTSHLPKKEKLATIFNRLDVDGNGLLEAADLRRICQGTWTDEELDRMIKVADKNGDGQVDYDEFLSLMQDSPARTD